jgi:hypothetical protein
VARQEQAPADEAKARALAEQESLRADLEHLHRLVKDLRIDLALRRLRHKYSPDQPRVPAGNPDGGQWTDGGGSGADRSAVAGRSESVGLVLSDESPDPIRPGAQYAQGGYSVDLHQEEARGGHTIEKHVNRSPEALIAQVLEVFDERPKAHDVRSGSFPSVEAATKLVSSTLAQNQAVVDRVASGELCRAVVLSQFGSVTGTEAVMANSRSQPYFQDTYGVGVVIIHDPFSPRRYSIVSAFPSNRRLP